MKTPRVVIFLSFALVSMLAACSEEREVEARGEVKDPSGVSAQAVVIDFYDLPKEEGGEEKKVDSLKLEKAGPFSHKVSVSGDKLRLFALADANGSGACDAGEAWATAEVAIMDDDTVTPAVLELRAQTSCPGAK